MLMPLTENANTGTLRKLGWKISSPTNTYDIVIAPPIGMIDFMGQASGGREMGYSTHQALLARGLREYSGIWRTLADM